MARPGPVRGPSIPADPRWYQIGSLALLLAWGLGRLGFDVGAPQVAVTVGTALAVQLLGTTLARLPRFDPKSALISSLSLCLLLRTNALAIAALGAAIAVGSKFLVRVRGKHLFNPTTLALALLYLADLAWISPGQWGSAALLAFLVACLGGLVVFRSSRSDVTLAFLLAWSGLLAARALRLGDPASIPLHQVESGSLLLFAFFMISDPKTTPDSRAGRVVFGALVAAGAYAVQFLLFRTNGLVLSLVALSPLVPLLDLLLPGPRYAWPTKGAPDEAPRPAVAPPPDPAAHPPLPA